MNQNNLFDAIKQEMERNKTMNVTIEKTNGHYLIASYSDQTGMSVSRFPVFHAVRETAQREAERLAKANPGKRFVVLSVNGSVVTNGVQWS